MIGQTTVDEVLIEGTLHRHLADSGSRVTIIARTVVDAVTAHLSPSELERRRFKPNTRIMGVGGQVRPGDITHGIILDFRHPRGDTAVPTPCFVFDGRRPIAQVLLGTNVLGPLGYSFKAPDGVELLAVHEKKALVPVGGILIDRDFVDLGIIDVAGMAPHETMGVTPDMFYDELPSALDSDLEELLQEMEDLLKEVEAASVDLTHHDITPPVAIVSTTKTRVIPTGKPKLLRLKVAPYRGHTSLFKDNTHEFLFEPSPELAELGLTAETAILRSHDRTHVKVALKNTSMWPVCISPKQRVGTLTSMADVIRYDEIVKDRGKDSTDPVLDSLPESAALDTIDLTPDRREKLLQLFQSDTWHASSTHRAALEATLLQNHDLFALSENELGEVADVEHIIDTGENPPITQRCRRVHNRDMDDLYADLQMKLDAGIIEDSKSPWASPIVLVRKKGSGDLRLTVDYGKVNEVTKKGRIPHPPLH